MATNKNRTEVMRIHPEFKKFISGVQARKYVSQKKLIRTSRITLAVLNQYRKYPNLLEELEMADLK